MSVRTIATQWASYREQVLPVDAAPIHVSETQLAFYAGAEALYVLLMSGLTPGPDAADDDVDLLDRVQKELKAFAEVVGKGDRPGRVRR